jgi:hypothetical protein
MSWRDETARMKLHGYADWLRNTPDALWCDVVTVSPRIRLPWHYTPEQEIDGNVWECGAVWLHCAGLPNGEVYSADVIDDLRLALETLKQDVEKARYTLLVNPDGMAYDPMRLGGDHQVRVPASGRRFTLSVRRGSRHGSKVMLAIDWGITP